jgi:hypothetical protein
MNNPTTFALQLPVREDAEKLLEVYFTYTQSWLPIIGKDDLMATYYRSIELSESSVSMGEHAALWAVLAYAECQRSPAPRNSKGETYLRFSHKAEAYYEKTRSLITAKNSGHDIGHVQALLVLSLIKITMGQFRDAWLFINHAINISIDIGIGISSTPNQSSTLSVGREKHVFLGCFCLDTLIAVCLGRCPRIQSDDVETTGFLEENGLEEWGHLALGDRRGIQSGPARSLGTFNQLIRLLCILNKLGAMRFHETVSEQIQTSFNQWKYSVPAYCSVKIGSKGILETSALLPHQFNLSITYSICLEILKRRLHTKSDTFSEMVKSLRRTTDLPHCHSQFGSAAFPPVFYLAAHLSSGITGLREMKETIQRPSLRVNSSRRDCGADGEGIAKGIISSGSMDDLHPIANAHIPESLKDGTCVTSTGESGYDSQNHHTMSESYEDVEMVNGLNLRRTSGLNTSESLVSTSQANWNSRTDSRPPMTTRISVSDQRVAQEGLASNPASDPNAFFAAGNFHFSQSSRIEQENQMGRSGSTGVGSHLASFSNPYAETIGIPEVRIDPGLRGMTSADDLFFDLLNLEQFSGDRDETYRKLGFLFPSDTQDRFPSPSYDGQSLATYPLVANAAGEWSPLFGQPSGSGPSRDDARNSPELHALVGVAAQHLERTPDKY